MVRRVTTPHQHSHQVKPLVLVVSHCLAFLIIDRVVDMLCQSICVWMIHHCDTLLNATQCGHVCCHLPCEPNGMVRPHHHLCTITPFLVLSHKAWCCVCCMVTHCLFHPLTLWHGQSPPHHSMVGSWHLWFTHQIKSNALKQCSDVWLWCQW